jgi:hypothetical protein
MYFHCTYISLVTLVAPICALSVIFSNPANFWSCLGQMFNIVKVKVKQSNYRP